MPRSKARDEDVDLALAWPTQAAAAQMLGLSASILSRRQDLAFATVGAKGRHYSPAAVLEAGVIYKRRSLNAIAAKLLAYARHNGPQHLESVQGEIESFFAERPAPPVDRERFLKEARRALPRRLFREVERAFEEGVPAEPELQGAEVEFAPGAYEAG